MWQIVDCTFLIAVGIVPPILLIAVSYEECNRIVFIVLIVLIGSFWAGYYPGMRVNILDLSPNYAGALLAYTNGVGVIASFIFPGITGMIITDVRQIMIKIRGNKKYRKM